MKLRVLVWWMSAVVAGMFSAPGEPVDAGEAAWKDAGLSASEFWFQEGNRLVFENDLDDAVRAYGLLLGSKESAAVHHNLGIAQYLRGETGMAVLHLERALRSGYSAARTAESLSFIRNSEGISPPRFTVLQVLARTLPEELWMLLLVGSFWVAMICGGYLFLLVKRKAVYRDVAIISWMIFIVSCVACVGLEQDGDFGVLVNRTNGLKVVPTAESAVFLELRGGEMVRHLKGREHFVFVETSSGVRGWVLRDQFQWVRESER
jgi:hypothetical protein